MTLKMTGKLVDHWGGVKSASVFFSTLARKSGMVAELWKQSILLALD